jgi:formate-dependent nitrite reductase cytochrome c552 subunit
MKSKKKSVKKFFAKFPKLVILWPGYHVAKNTPKGKRKKKVQASYFINSEI